MAISKHTARIVMSNKATDQQLTQLGNESFNVPAIARFMDAEAKAAYGGSERTQIELVARLVRAQQSELEELRDRLTKINDNWPHVAEVETEHTLRLQAQHERDCAIEDVKRLTLQIAQSCHDARSDPEFGGCPLEKRAVDVPAEPKPCEHLRSDLLAEKQKDGEPLFQMRKCLDCEKTFRVRTSVTRTTERG